MRLHLEDLAHAGSSNAVLLIGEAVFVNLFILRHLRMACVENITILAFPAIMRPMWYFASIKHLHYAGSLRLVYLHENLHRVNKNIRREDV